MVVASLHYTIFHRDQFISHKKSIPFQNGSHKIHPPSSSANSGKLSYYIYHKIPCYCVHEHTIKWSINFSLFLATFSALICFLLASFPLALLLSPLLPPPSSPYSLAVSFPFASFSFFFQILVRV